MKQQNVWVVSYVYDDTPEMMLLKGRLRDILRHAHAAFTCGMMDQDTTVGALGLTSIKKFIAYWTDDPHMSELSITRKKLFVV